MAAKSMRPQKVHAHCAFANGRSARPVLDPRSWANSQEDNTMHS